MSRVYRVPDGVYRLKTGRVHRTPCPDSVREMTFSGCTRPVHVYQAGTPQIYAVNRKKKEVKEQIFAMWMACHTQQEIAEAVGVDQSVVSDKIADFMGNDQMTDSHIFRNFEPTRFRVEQKKTERNLRDVRASEN